jgi:hypothetical protein
MGRGDIGTPQDPPDLRGYIEMALASGFPEPALRLSEPARQRWLESYVEQLVTRDAVEVDHGRDPQRLRRYLEACATVSAGVVHDSTLYEAAGINRRTAMAYDRLLQNLLVIEHVPAWTSNRLRRLIRSPKRYLVDAGLFPGILRLDTRAVLRDGDLLGRVLDTFVASQIRSDLPVTESRPRLFHLRTEQGRHEVDLIAELAGGPAVGIEVKATSAPRSGDARHLVWLRDALGHRFAAGVVLHTGTGVYQLDQGITAAPICALWA